ncbi:hypothetical protein KKA39_02385 [Patescibacteria group bacterium]|nr:hypothetical protein [Patescibacteria group bacterium]MBU1728128.1 hypothetical protein [Patescibacteria group bacterium]
MEKPWKFKKEKSILEDYEKLAFLSRKLEKVYANRPNLNDFVGAMKGTKFEENYTQERIDDDLAFVNFRRSKIEEKESSSGQRELERKSGSFALSEISQAIVVDQINNYGWLKDFKATMTSDYDDLSVGIDAVLKSKNEKGYLGAAFDFTSSVNPMIINKKIRDEWDFRIKKGSVPTVKYFRDPDTQKQQSLVVPKFIIGISREDVENMARAYLENREDSLAEYRLQYLIIEQIEVQLNYILDFYDKHKNGKNFGLARKQYQTVEKIIKHTKNEMGYGELPMDKKLELHEYFKNSIALDLIKSFGLAREVEQ